MIRFCLHKYLPSSVRTLTILQVSSYGERNSRRTRSYVQDPSASSSVIYLPSPFRHGGSTASLSALDNAAVAVSLNPAHPSPGKRQQVLMAAEATRLSLPNLDPIEIEEVTNFCVWL